jgi:hypothetical protein
MLVQTSALRGYLAGALVYRLVPALVSKNQLDCYDLRQPKPHFSTNLVGT